MGRKKKKLSPKELVTNNLKLVMKMAHKYKNRGLEIEDLIQEGTIGLMRASTDFDASLGYQFSTYATWWIRQSILRAIQNTGRSIRLPSHMHGKLLELRRKTKELQDKNQRIPTIGELAKAIDVSEEDVIKMQLASSDTISLDTPVHEEDSTLEDFVADSQDSVLDSLISFNQKEVIEEALNSLTEKEAMVLRLRFGIDTDEELTLEAIGEQNNVSKERIRQIEAKALAKLKHPSRIKMLKKAI